MERDLHLRDNTVSYTEIPNCTWWGVGSDESGNTKLTELTGHVIIERNGNGPGRTETAKFVPDIFVNNFKSPTREEQIPKMDGSHTVEITSYRYYLGFGHAVSPLAATPAWGCIWIPYTRERDGDRYVKEKNRALLIFIQHEEDFLLDGWRLQQDIEKSIAAFGKGME